MNHERWVRFRHLAATGVAFGLMSLGCASSQASSPAEDDALAGADDLYGANAELAISIRAPFATILKRAKAGAADPGTAGADPKYSEQGTLSYGGKTYNVRIAARGNSSLNECTFPKFSVDFDDTNQTKGTLFQGHGKFRVNSHCGDGKVSDHSEGMMRVLNEVGPVREELSYRTLRAAGVPTYQTRLLRISYTDSSVAGAFASVTRYALAIESGKDAAKRFAKEGLLPAGASEYLNGAGGDPTLAGADHAYMREDDVARLYLAEALLGNEDWSLSSKQPQRIWNVDVFGAPKRATQLPIPQDFDLAYGVQALSDPLFTPEVAVHAEMLKFRRFVTNPAVIKRASDSFLAKRAAIAAEIERVEKEAIAAKRVPSTDGRTSTDLGFQNVHKLYDAFFSQPELKR